jgi:hypothetical protein
MSAHATLLGLLISHPFHHSFNNLLDLGLGVGL